ncbi:MAG: MASE4 domain-containing protein, partial [Casimicrobiaceae bacterium]
MLTTAPAVPEDEYFLLSNLSPGRTQKRLALAIVFSLLVVLYLVTGPLSGIKLGEINAFVASYAAAMFTIDSITAILLFAQFSILRSRAILVIANGYLFTALIVGAWILAFPGVFAPNGLIGGLQSTAWLYVVWHCGFPLFVIGYALLKDPDPGKQVWPGTVGAAIALSVALTVAIVAAAVFVCVAVEPSLPHLMVDPSHFSSLWPFL